MTFRDIPVSLEVGMQGIQGIQVNSLEFRGIQGNTGKEEVSAVDNVTWSTIMLQTAHVHTQK